MINNDYNKSKKITFLNLSIAETFYAKLPKDLSLLKANLNNMTFINQFSIDIRKDEIFINILLHVPFAFNDNDNTVIFQNGTLAKSIFFDKAFVINRLSSKENLLLNKWYRNLSSLNKSRKLSLGLYELSRLLLLKFSTTNL